MPNKPNFLDINLLGKEYRVTCLPDEYNALLESVAYVNEKLEEIAGKTKSTMTERLAVMAALNIANDYLKLRSVSGSGAVVKIEKGLDFNEIKRRIINMEAQLDMVLAPEEKLP